jgi:hypothetical protein
VAAARARPDSAATAGIPTALIEVTNEGSGLEAEAATLYRPSEPTGTSMPRISWSELAFRARLEKLTRLRRA